MLIASLVTSCLALFLHAGTCPEGSLPGLSSAQPEIQSSEFQVRFQFANEQQPERGGPSGPHERGMTNGPEGRGGFGGQEGGLRMDERARGDHSPDVQHLLQRIQQFERQLERQPDEQLLHNRRGPGRGEHAKGGLHPSRQDKHETKRGQRRGEKRGGMQSHRDGFEGGHRGEMGGRGMDGRPGGMLPPGGPGRFDRRGEMIERMRGTFRERVGQHLPEIREQIRQRMIKRAGPGGSEGRRGPREQIRIERQGGPGRDAGPMEGPNERRIPREGSEIRIETHGDGNARPQSATDPRLERILNMVERLNERLDRLEEQTSHREGGRPQDRVGEVRPGEAPRPRGPQGGDRGVPDSRPSAGPGQDGGR